MTLGETLKLLSPELVLLLTGLVILGTDLAWGDDKAKARWIPGLALAGLALALAATLWLWPGPPTTVLAMMAVDPFALFFKVIAIGTVALVVLAASIWQGASAGADWPFPGRDPATAVGVVSADLARLWSAETWSTDGLLRLGAAPEEHFRRDDQTRKPLVVGRHDIPWRMPGAGVVQHVFISRLILAPVLAFTGIGH